MSDGCSARFPLVSDPAMCGNTSPHGPFALLFPGCRELYMLFLPRQDVYMFLGLWSSACPDDATCHRSRVE